MRYEPSTRLGPPNLLLSSLSSASQHPLLSCLDCFFDSLIGCFWLLTYRNTGVGLSWYFPWSSLLRQSIEHLQKGLSKPLRTRGRCLAVAEIETRALTVWSAPMFSPGQWDLKMQLLPFKKLLRVGEISGATRKFFWREDFFNIGSFHELCLVWSERKNSCSLCSFKALILSREREASSFTLHLTTAWWPMTLVNP